MTLTPLALMGLGVPELVIILVVVLLLFGGTRLAGLGKSSGRALKEFKEETKGLRDGDKPATQATPALPSTTSVPTDTAYPAGAYQAPVNPVPQQQYPAGQVNGSQTNGSQVNGAQANGAQAWTQTPPANLADPAAGDTRRDV